MNQTATGAALSIPEILSLIFSNGSPRTQAACARVCKTWSEVALAELWRDLEDIYPLLKLVIPFESFYDEYGEDEFMREETLDLLWNVDWPRFRHHASRVRSITFDGSYAKVSPPSHQGIAVICLHHPYGNCLTPNVQTLRWRLSCGKTIVTMLPFISQRLEELRLEVYLESMQAREVFLGLTSRTPTLKRLSIDSGVSLSELSPSFYRWIQTCLNLEKVHIPRRWQTSSMVTALESLPNLSEFGIEWGLVPGEDTGLRMEMEITEGHFRNLRRLGWSSGIERATDLLHQTSHKLQGLALDCVGSPSQEEVGIFLTTAVVCCPGLDSLFLNLTSLAEPVDPDGALSFEILRPLVACKRLRELRIHYSCPCILSILDVEEMGAAWPDMEELVICPDPSDEEPLGTPISNLPHVAAAFPQLRILGLYVDPHEPPGSVSDLLPETQFRRLRELDVGSSSVPRNDTAAVGLYLASLFAVGTKPSIKAGVSDARCNSFYGSIDNEAWEAIERLVHLTMGVKEAFLCRLSSR